MNLFELLFLIVGTGTLALVSWRVSLAAGRFHGVYRFFSFEAILVLVLMNWSFWFVDPFSFAQLLSWSLLTLSVVPVLAGLRALRSYGEAEGQFENTQVLVEGGIYRYIRHPMYLSLMMLGTGVCLKDLSWSTGLLAALNIAALTATALKEEKEMVRKFGSGYLEYMSRTKRFLPNVV